MKRFYNDMRRLLFGICLAVFGLCGLTIARDIYPYARERATNGRLARQVRENCPKAGKPASRTDAGPRGNPSPLPQYASLYRQNPDLAGWLRIEGTKIDYPVMYTPQEPEYYLSRDFYGASSPGGCLFIGEGYQKEGGNTIIYGHHRKDGSMFAGLLSYDDPEFAREHSVIRFDTVFEEGTYEIAAAFYCDLDAAEAENFDYYKYPDLSDPEVFDDYISRVKERDVMNTGTEIQFGDQLLTLSTCCYHVKNGRFVVTAKKVE